MLISAEYREEQTTLHENPNYGVASLSYAPMVTSLINNLQVSHVLDYGAGKGRLAQAVEPEHKITIELYDPAIKEISEAPNPAELVCCIDVLEHIEPECLDDVLDDLQRVTSQYGFFTIHTGPAVKELSDGRNAHLTQEPYTWWLPKLWSRFHIHQMTQDAHGFFVIVRNQHGP